MNIGFVGKIHQRKFRTVPSGSSSVLSRKYAVRHQRTRLEPVQGKERFTMSGIKKLEDQDVPNASIFAEARQISES
jgi:hypothetical protein